MDHTCIICLDCYKNSNHDNHRVVFKKGGGGCCDCGDVEAWKKEGFCLKHSGETLEVDLDANLAESLTAIFEDLFYLYFRLALKKEKSSRKANLPLVLLGTLSELNSKGPQYNKFLSLLLQRTLP